jgi:hypothetical protein
MLDILIPATENTGVTSRNRASPKLDTTWQTVMSESPQMNFHFAGCIDFPDHLPIPFFINSSRRHTFSTFAS